MEDTEIPSDDLNKHTNFRILIEPGVYVYENELR